MEYNKFINLCTALGKDNLETGKEWKTLKYIHTPGQSSPAVDVERALLDKTIDFIADPDNPGFAVIEPPTVDVILSSTDDRVVTFLDLSHIYCLSFITNDSVVDIYDIVNKFNDVGFPVAIYFNELPDQERTGDNELVYHFNSVKDVNVKFSMSRKLKKDSDYNMVITDLDTNKVVDKFDNNKEGYRLKITCLGKYQGENSCIIKIN